MRTKTLLLSAVALLAAGFVSTQAQPVYSQNVVGYASVKTTSGNTYALTVPFKIGVSNGANEVWPLDGLGNPTIPDFSTLLIWTGTGYQTYVSDSGSPTLWDMYDQSTPTNAPEIPVSQAFFLTPGGDTTNVFAGVVAVIVGSSNVVHLASGNTYFVAPAVPYGGTVTNGSPTTGVGGPNLWSPDGVQGLPDFSTVLIWTGTGYQTYVSDSGSATYWDMYDQSTPTNAPVLNVGQGFFLTPGGDFSWKVGL